MDFSSNMTSRGCTFFPGVEKRGVCRTAVEKRALPLPPRPPRSTVISSVPRTSATTRPLSLSIITVPAGTLMTTSAPVFPRIFFFRPFSPFSARNFLWYLKSISVRIPGSAAKTTLPPLPPSPPSGPPALTYFSRLNETAPLPPSPALMMILTLSTIINFYPYRGTGPKYNTSRTEASAPCRPACRARSASGAPLTNLPF